MIITQVSQKINCWLSNFKIWIEIKDFLPHSSKKSLPLCFYSCLLCLRTGAVRVQIEIWILWLPDQVWKGICLQRGTGEEIQHLQGMHISFLYWQVSILPRGWTHLNCEIKYMNKYVLMKIKQMKINNIIIANWEKTYIT